jgi:hypothetical protein
MTFKLDWQQFIKRNEALEDNTVLLTIIENVQNVLSRPGYNCQFAVSYFVLNFEASF